MCAHYICIKLVWAWNLRNSTSLSSNLNCLIMSCNEKVIKEYLEPVGNNSLDRIMIKHYILLSPRNCPESGLNSQSYGCKSSTALQSYLITNELWEKSWLELNKKPTWVNSAIVPNINKINSHTLVPFLSFLTSGTFQREWKKY